MDPLALIAILDAGLALIGRGQAYIDLVKKARAENRDVTAEELQALRDADDAARVAESEAIANARAREAG